MAIIGRNIDAAGKYLAEGQVVGIPTETVYGLAADIRNDAALKLVFAIKQRPSNNPLIVHAGDVAQVQELVSNFPPLAAHLARHCWPGPLTMILPKAAHLSKQVTAGQDTVAVRIPSHPLTLRLLQEERLALAAPSANPFNYISPVTAAQVEAMLGSRIPYILDGGRCRSGLESTIIAFEGEGIRILRPGAFTEEDLLAVAGVPVWSTRKSDAPAHPGMFKRHYSPRTPLYLSHEPWAEAGKHEAERVALLFFRHPPPDDRPTVAAFALSPDGSAAGAAANLYHLLHQLDNGDFDCIIAELLPPEGLGRAVNDRLSKAGQFRDPGV